MTMPENINRQEVTEIVVVSLDGTAIRAGLKAADVDVTRSEIRRVIDKTCRDPESRYLGRDVRTVAGNLIADGFEVFARGQERERASQIIVALALWWVCEEPEPIGSFMLRVAKRGGDTLRLQLAPNGDDFKLHVGTDLKLLAEMQAEFGVDPMPAVMGAPHQRRAAARYLRQQQKKRMH